MIKNETTRLHLEAARGAFGDAVARPSAATFDDAVFTLMVLTRSGEAPGRTIRDIAAALRIDAMPLVPAVHEWLRTVALPMIEPARARLASMPMGEHLLGGDGTTEAARAVRAFLLGLFEHRDALEAAYAILVAGGESAAASHDACALDDVDDLLRNHLLRAVSLNEERRRIAEQLPAELRRRLWWWSELASLDADALLRYSLDDLQLDRTRHRQLEAYLARDARLATYVIALREGHRQIEAAVARQRGGRPALPLAASGAASAAVDRPVTVTVRAGTDAYELVAAGGIVIVRAAPDRRAMVIGADRYALDVRSSGDAVVVGLTLGRLIEYYDRSQLADVQFV